jgi:hypothetical protein
MVRIILEIVLTRFASLSPFSLANVVKKVECPLAPFHFLAHRTILEIVLTRLFAWPPLRGGQAGGKGLWRAPRGLAG